MEHVSSVFYLIGSSGSQAMVSSEAMVSSGSQADLVRAKHRRSSPTLYHHMDYHWYTRAIGYNDPAEQCKPGIGILLWKKTRLMGMALVSLLACLPGRSTATGQGWQGSPVQQHYPCQLQLMLLRLSKFGSGGLGGGILLWLSFLYGARFIKRRTSMSIPSTRIFHSPRCSRSDCLQPQLSGKDENKSLHKFVDQHAMANRTL